eukprot:TRINITY_DN1199_c0_g3_i2.p1 TRINITY_DN1199_c0_g3~~TRINITY_DN1199_c0_g3_i2.p1  ORF type:complete len:894 (+),score=123.09 TRINITY_DN1199_c0_g3_i2:672-3353(+)
MKRTIQNIRKMTHKYTDWMKGIYMDTRKTMEFLNKRGIDQTPTRYKPKHLLPEGYRERWETIMTKMMNRHNITAEEIGTEKGNQWLEDLSTIRKEAKKIYKRLLKETKQDIQKENMIGLQELGEFSYKKYKRIREGKKHNLRLAEVKDKEGNIWREPQKVKQEVMDGFQRIYNTEFRKENQITIQKPWKKLPIWDKYRDKAKQYLDEKGSLLKPVGIREAWEILKTADNNSGPGLDGITYGHLKHLPENWKHVVLNIINWILHKKHVPAIMKETLIYPIYKNRGDTRAITSYRGIALQKTLLKLTNMIITARKAAMKTYMQTHMEAVGAGKTGISTYFRVHAITCAIAEMKRTQKQGAIISLDLYKGYDMYREECIVDVCECMGYEEDLKKFMIDLNRHAKAAVQTPYGLTEEFIYAQGRLKQGGPESVDWYGDWTELLTRWLESEKMGITVTRMQVPNFETDLPTSILITSQTFVDDIAMALETPQIRKATGMVDNFLGAYRTRINEKCEAQVINGANRAEILGMIQLGENRGSIKLLPQGAAIKILGFWINPDTLGWEDHEEQIRSKIQSKTNQMMKIRMGPTQMIKAFNSEIGGLLNYSSSLVIFSNKFNRWIKRKAKEVVMGLNDAMGISFDQISRTDKGVNIKDPRATNMAIAIASLGKLMEDRDHQVTQATQIMLWNMKHTLNGGISVLQATAQSSSSTTKNWKEFPRLLAIIKSDAARYRIKLHSFHLDAPLERMTLKQFIAEVALIPGRDMKRNVLKKKDPIFNWPISFLDPRFSTENMRRMLTKRTTHTDTEKMENDIFPDKTLPATWMKAILADPTAIKYGAFANPKAYYRYLTLGVHKVKDTIAATDGSYGKSKSKYNASGAIVTVGNKKVTFTLINTKSIW